MDSRYVVFNIDGSIHSISSNKKIAKSMLVNGMSIELLNPEDLTLTKDIFNKYQLIEMNGYYMNIKEHYMIDRIINEIESELDDLSLNLNLLSQCLKLLPVGDRIERLAIELNCKVDNSRGWGLQYMINNVDDFMDYNLSYIRRNNTTKYVTDDIIDEYL